MTPVTIYLMIKMGQKLHFAAVCQVDRHQVLGSLRGPDTPEAPRRNHIRKICTDKQPSVTSVCRCHSNWKSVLHTTTKWQQTTEEMQGVTVQLTFPSWTRLKCLRHALGKRTRDPALMISKGSLTERLQNVGRVPASDSLQSLQTYLQDQSSREDGTASAPMNSCCQPPSFEARKTCPPFRGIGPFAAGGHLPKTLLGWENG